MTCPRLPPLLHGHTEGAGRQYGDTVEHSCNPGYRLAGSARQICLDSGVWSGPAPVCSRVSCHAPTLEHGSVHSPDPLLPGLAAQFNCQEGFDLEGPAEVDCTESGELSVDPPVCQPQPCHTPPM